MSESQTFAAAKDGSAWCRLCGKWATDEHKNSLGHNSNLVKLEKCDDYGGTWKWRDIPANHDADLLPPPPPPPRPSVSSSHVSAADQGQRAAPTQAASAAAAEVAVPGLPVSGPWQLQAIEELEGLKHEVSLVKAQMATVVDLLRDIRDATRSSSRSSDSKAATAGKGAHNKSTDKADKDKKSQGLRSDRDRGRSDRDRSDRDRSDRDRSDRDKRR